MPAAAPKRQAASPTKSRTLTRNAIVSKARTLLQEEGIGALSIRRLAGRLSVSPMALYRHVADRQDLLEAVLVDIIRHDDIAAHDETDWRAWLVETCKRMRRSLMQNPEIIPIFAETDRMSAAELASFDRVLSRLSEAGLSDEMAAKAFHVTVSFTFGSLAYEQFKFRKLTNKKLPTKKELAASHPSVARAARHLATPLSDTEFEASLKRILQGF